MLWLRRSIIGEGMKPLELNAIEGRLRETGIIFENVRTINPYKVLITFKSIEELEKAEQNGKEKLLTIVDDFRRWDIQEVSNVRRVWLECKGLPLHGWSNANVEKIGVIWGKVVQCDCESWDCTGFQSARVLIDTTVMSSIEGWVCFDLDGIIFDVHVNELKRVKDVSVKSSGHGMLGGVKIEGEEVQQNSCEDGRGEHVGDNALFGLPWWFYSLPAYEGTVPSLPFDAKRHMWNR